MHRCKLAAAIVSLGILGTIGWADNAATSGQSAPPKASATTAQASQAPATQQDAKVKIIEMEAGDAGARDGDIVLVYYTGRLEDGKVFDSTDNHGGKPFQFPLGQGRVIKGWDQGIVGMKIGQKRQLVIPPELAYGAAGQGPIPANATLTFDVQLVGLVRLAKTEDESAK